MDLNKLKTAYNKDDAVSAICDNMAERAKNQKQTKLHRIIHHLKQDGYDVKRPSVIAAFRQLEDAGCGQYIEGRHGHKSRFDWAVKSMLVKDALTGNASSASVEEEDEGAIDEYDCEMVEHTYVLRPDLSITLELPEDLTYLEAERLSQFVGSLSFSGI